MCVRHAEFEGPGLFETIAHEHGIELHTVATDLGEPVPDASGVGGVVVMGGPFSVSEIDTRPHLAKERRLLTDAARNRQPVMAICLGAQLLASGLGAHVGMSPREERGMYEVALTLDGLADPMVGPERPTLRVFQFHDNAFDLPPGATALATSQSCPNQSFRFGDRAYGLQFHIELPSPFAAHIPETERPTHEERETLSKLGRRIIDRFFRIATAG